MTTPKVLTFEEWVNRHPELVEKAEYEASLEIKFVDCPDCGGDGEHSCPYCGQDMECRTCDGSGKVEGKRKEDFLKEWYNDEKKRDKIRWFKFAGTDIAA